MSKHCMCILLLLIFVLKVYPQDWLILRQNMFQKLKPQLLFKQMTNYQCLFFSIQIDKQLASGEYFLQEKERRLKAQQEKKVHMLPNKRISLI